MRKITLLLSLLLAITAAAQTTTPTGSNGSEKTFYKFKIAYYGNDNNYIIADEGNTEKPFRGRAANENETKPEAIFTFEATEDEETDVYYIYSEDYGAYLSYTETKDNSGDYGGKPVTYSKDKSITEKWKLIPHDTNKTNVAIVNYTDKDKTNGGDRYGLNVSGDPYGPIVLWKTASGNGASFFQLEVVDSETVAADITARINNVEQNLEKCGKQLVGYPTSTSSKVQEALTTAQQNRNLADAKALQRAFNDFWNNTDISDIKLPEDGKIYRLISVLEDGTKRYVYADGEEIKWQNEPVEDAKAYFVCQNVGENVRLASLTATGLFSTDNSKGIITEELTDKKSTYFHFDHLKATKMGCITLVSEISNSTDWRVIGTLIKNNNGVLDYWSADKNNLANHVGTSESTDYIFEEVPMLTEISDSENEVASNSDENGNGEINEEYIYKVNLTYGHNREDEYSYYGTLYLPFAVKLPQNVKAYMVKPSDDWTILEEVELSLGEGNTLPAGTPVLLKGETEGADVPEAAAEGSQSPKVFTFTIAANAGATATVADTEGDNAGSSIEDNGLRGRYSDGAPEAGTTYILALTGQADIDQDGEDSENEVRFFRLEGNEVNGNKAYYLIPTASGASLATIALSGGNRVTAIENAATTTTDAAAACYDLSGRQVTKPAAGLYIVGGKKVFVK